MRRIALVIPLAVLAFAPAAVAKGPHVSISPGPTGIEPGEPWIATLTLHEYRRHEAAAARPRVILRGEDTRFTVRPRRRTMAASGPCGCWPRSRSPAPESWRCATVAAATAEPHRGNLGNPLVNGGTTNR